MVLVLLLYGHHHHHYHHHHNKAMAMDFQPHQYPSVSERRDHRLAPLETNFSRPNNNHARPTLRPAVANNRPRPHADDQANERVPLQQPPVKRQSSMSSLRSLFGRDKPARKHPPQSHSKLAEIDEVHHHPTATATATETNPDTTTNNNSHTTVTQTQPETPLSPSFCATPTTTSTFTPAAATTTSTKPPGKKPSARDLGWKPPPLFQAYPQAVKHGTLPAPTRSADAILRVHATSKGGGPRDEESTGAGLSQQKQETPEAHVARLKKENKEKKHMRSVSETISKTDWTEKIYVVTTSGYILQYAGEGKHDRLPEKMLLLGPKSVAFASDAIPGKHWVLQVSQDPQAESTTTNSAADTPRPLLARLGFHRSYTRRLTQSFLLVFTDPDELSSWLLTVRAQIETRGGKKYVSERVFDDGMEQQLRPKVSARQLVKKDPNRVSSLFLQPQLDVQSEADELSVLGLSRQSSYASNNRRSIISSTTHTDVTAPSTSNHGGSSGGSGGGSGSGGGRFYAGSSTEAAATQSPALSNPKKRQSMLYISSQPPVTPQTETPQSSRPPSTVPEPFVRSTSPPAPNFSVPSFSKRFAARSGMTRVPPLQLGNRVNEEELDNNAIPVFPSPPQSPSHSLSSMSRNDSTDPYPPLVSRQSSLARRPLRVSNSQDSLVTSEQTTQQYQDRKATTTTTTPTPTPTTRPPRGSVSTLGSAARPSRPISIVSSGDASLSSEAQLPQSPLTPSPTHASSSRRDPHRSRTSVLYPTNNSNVTYSPMPNISRRKSAAALNVPPPVVPPPNCPLPKIPSADLSGDGDRGREGAISPPPQPPPSSEKMRVRRRKFSTTTTSSGSTSNTTASSSYHPRFSLGLRTSGSSRHMNANVI